MGHGLVVRLRVSILGRSALSRFHSEHIASADALLDSEHHHQHLICADSLAILALESRISLLRDRDVACDSHPRSLSGVCCENHEFAVARCHGPYTQ